jgi:hypothetical protein
VQGIEHAAAATDREVELRAARPAAAADAAEERTGVDPVSDPTVKGRFVGVDGVVAVPLIDHEEKPEVGHPAGEDDPSVRDRVDGRSPRGGDEDAVPETDARAVRLAEGPDEPSLNRPGESAAKAREGERNARRPGNPREGTVETAEKTCEGVCAGEEEIEESPAARDFPSEGGEESATLGTDGREMQKRARLSRAERAEFGGSGLETGQHQDETGDGGAEDDEPALLARCEDAEVGEEAGLPPRMTEITEEKMQTGLGPEHVALPGEEGEVAAPGREGLAIGAPSPIERADTASEGVFLPRESSERGADGADLSSCAGEKSADVRSGLAFAREGAAEETDAILDAGETGRRRARAEDGGKSEE